MALMVNTTNCLLLMLFLLLAFPAYGQEIGNYKNTQTKFEVLSARVMSTDESIRKQSDNIAIDISVRLRLTNLGETTIFYYTNWKDNVIPYGHTVIKTEKGKRWFNGFAKVAETSPGIGKLTLGGGGAWLRLPSETSIEWESFSSTIWSGEQHAHTFFMKVGDKGAITEVFSDFYTVPIRDSK